MQSDEYILSKLDTQGLTNEQKAAALEQVKLLVGEAINEQLSDEQRDEYLAIINDDSGVLKAWLSENIPEYKQSVIYQQFEAGVEQDPERNNPEKLFASLAWVEFNVPNAQEITDRVIESFEYAP